MKPSKKPDPEIAKRALQEAAERREKLDVQEWEKEFMAGRGRTRRAMGIGRIKASSQIFDN